MRFCSIASTVILAVLPTAAAADVIDFTADVVTDGAVIDRLPGATVSQGVSGLYADGLAQFEGGAYNYYGANGVFITFDAPTGLGTIDVWVVPESLDHLTLATTLTFEMTDAKGSLISQVDYTPTGAQDTVTLGASNVTTLTIHHTGGSDTYGDGYLSAWYWIDTLTLTTCGDGVVDESCDDGGLVDGDGCASDCTVEDGYTCSGEPSVCEDIDECDEGTDTCPEHSTCANTAGSYDCSCDDGFSAEAEACVDIDECADGTHECHADASCENLEGSYDCSCSDGFVGDGWDCTPEDDGSGDDSGTDGGDDTADEGDDKGGSTGCAHVGAAPLLGWLAVLAMAPRRRRRV